MCLWTIYGDWITHNYNQRPFYLEHRVLAIDHDQINSFKGIIIELHGIIYQVINRIKGVILLKFQSD